MSAKRLEASDSASLHRTQLSDWYATVDKLRLMQEAHAKYSQPQPPDFFGWVVQWLEAPRGALVLDAGCGHGAFHATLAKSGYRIMALDQSPGLVRQAMQNAQAHHWAFGGLCALVQNLPLRTGCCDGAMTNFVLHHVPEAYRVKALEELRRVVKPGGKVVISAHSPRHLFELRQLHQGAAAAHGFRADTAAFNSFTLNDLPLIQSVFGAARVEQAQSAFVFPTAETVLQYYSSQMIDLLLDRPADNGHRPALLEWVAARVAAVVRREGVFRDEKTHGCFIASVA